MQRIEDNALIISCDFCGIDWDGVSPVIEGHRGSIVCLDCLKAALAGLVEASEEYKCILCLRDPVAASIERWNHQNHPQTYACGNCVHQAAEAFDRDPDVDWKWERKEE